MKNRIVFIDLLRGWATLLMIEVHVFNAFLYPDIREAGWFTLVNFMNGLVAPAFLFVAGMVFVIVSERKVEDFRSFGSAFWRQLGRITLIWGIGYILHIPFFSFTRIVNETTEAGLLKFFQVDILHCIALGLLILFLTRTMIRERAVFVRILVVLGLIAVLAAPIIWEIDFDPILPPFAAAYMNGQHFSQFPVFPWLGFMLFGGQAGVLYLEMKEAEKEGKFVWTLFWWGAVLIALYLLSTLLPNPPFAGSHIETDPLFFGLRFGIVLVLLVWCWYYAKIMDSQDSVIFDISKESLLVYTAHLLLLYGTFWNERSLVDIFGRSFSVFECALATVALAGLMIFAAKAWQMVKGKSRQAARRISFGMAFVALVVFFFK